MKDEKLFKVCAYCKKRFYNVDKLSTNKFMARQYCSCSCAGRARRGKRAARKSPETIEKIRLSNLAKRAEMAAGRCIYVPRIVKGGEECRSRLKMFCDNCNQEGK